MDTRLSYLSLIDKCAEKLKSSDLVLKLASYAYTGFNPASVVKSMQEREEDDDKLCEDLVFLLGLFHMRGPSIITDKKLKGLDEKSKTELNGIITKYNISSKANSSISITLTRISLAFPDASMMVRKHLSSGSKPTPYPVLDTEIFYPGTNLLYGNYTPCLITWEDFAEGDEISNLVILIHLMYASTLTYKTTMPARGSKRKSPSEYMAETYTFTKLSMTQSNVAQKHKDIFKESIIKMKLKWATFENAFKLFSNGQKPVMLPEDSKILKRYNELVASIIKGN